MKYEFYFSTADNGDHWHQIEARSLNAALSLFAEYALRNYSDISYLGTSYYVYNKEGKTSSRKMKASAKDYFWTFFNIQLKMENDFATKKVL